MSRSFYRSFFLSPPSVIPHPPTSFVIRGWWTSSTGEEADFESPLPSRQLVTAAGRWDCKPGLRTGHWGSPRPDWLDW